MGYDIRTLLMKNAWKIERKNRQKGGMEEKRGFNELPEVKNLKFWADYLFSHKLWIWIISQK